MKTKLFIIFVLFTSLIFAQNCSNFKQLYDYTHSKIPLSGGAGNHNGAYNYMLAADSYASGKIGESHGYLLESYIVMYKATKDKDYIFKAINESLLMMSWRLNNKKFCDTNFYKNGIVCWGIAHLAYLILIECPELKPLIIPSNILEIPNSTIATNVLPTMTYSLENIAIWLCLKTNEGLQEYISTNWVDANMAFKNDDDDNALGINMQSSFGAAMLYLGKIGTTNSNYSFLFPLLDYGATIARLYKQHISFEDKCACDDYDNDLLIETSDNSFWWYHSGWSTRRKNCINSCSPFVHTNQIEKSEYIQFKEDISHALVTLNLPKAANDINLFTHNNYPFSDEVMVKFRNMFSKKIFNGDFNNPNFSNAVDGSQQPIYPIGLPDNYFNHQSTAYMGLCKYDNYDATATQPNVYDIIMNYFQNYYNLGEISNGINIYGLSEIVNAYYVKECYDLTVYNRKLTYNQDFYAKHNLDIYPTAENCYHALNDESFADPIITTNTFTIEPNVNSTLSADNCVTLKGEVHFKAGSEVLVYNTTGNCYTDGKMGALLADNSGVTNFISSKPIQQALNPTHTLLNEKVSTTNELYDGKTSVNYKQNDIILNIYPNPLNSTEKLIAELKFANQAQLFIFDVSGRIIIDTKIVEGNNSITIPINSKGIFITKIITNEGLEFHNKLVVY